MLERGSAEPSNAVTLEAPLDSHSDRATHRVSRDLFEAIAPYATTKCYRRATLIYSAGDPAEHWYRVKAGIAARCADLSDGRRQIVELLVPGDFFGFTPGDAHLHAVEAVTDETTIVSYERRSVERVTASNPKLEGDLR